MGPILLVDLVSVLDTSKVGKEATWLLEKKWADAQKLDDAARKKASDEVLKKRDSLRASLLSRIKPAIEQLAKDKKATLVLEKSAALWAAGSEDITQAIIDKVDAQGPLLA